MLGQEALGPFSQPYLPWAFSPAVAECVPVGVGVAM